VLDAGTDVELTPAIAYEVRHAVDEVTATGEIRAIGASEPDAAALERALATARPHERISLLEEARARTAGDLKTLDAQIAAERKRLDTEAPKGDARPPASPRPKAVGDGS
jgi:hypothetical protein